MNFIIKTHPISQYQYLSKNKRYVSKRGKDFSKAFCKEIKEQMEQNNWKMLNSKNLQVEINFIFNNRRKNDLDNACKYVLDKLSDCNCIVEDRYITKLILEKEYKKVSETRMIIKIIDRDLE